MLLSGLALVGAITLRHLASTTVAVPSWTTRTITWALRYRIGQLLLRLQLSDDVNIYTVCVNFEVSTVMTMKNAVCL
jgi:hypothetical protein